MNMKKRTIRIRQLLTLFIIITSIVIFNKNANSMSELEISNDLDNFLLDFEKAVINHDSKMLLKLMDDDYVVEQHDGLLNGNTTQFLNEFFCGNLISGNGFKCLTFEEIKDIKRIKLVKHDQEYSVEYEVFSDQFSIKASWMVTIRELNGELIYGLYGAVG